MCAAELVRLTQVFAAALKTYWSGGYQWFEHISQAKPFSDRSCRKTLTLWARVASITATDFGLKGRPRSFRKP
jgi:hypothetical protein